MQAAKLRGNFRGKFDVKVKSDVTTTQLSRSFAASPSLRRLFQSRSNCAVSLLYCHFYAQKLTRHKLTVYLFPSKFVASDKFTRTFVMVMLVLYV